MPLDTMDVCSLCDRLLALHHPEFMSAVRTVFHTYASRSHLRDQEVVRRTGKTALRSAAVARQLGRIPCIQVFYPVDIPRLNPAHPELDLDSD